MTIVSFINSNIADSDINELRIYKYILFNNDVEFTARVMEVHMLNPLILFSEIIRC